jgi:ferredoxin/coenzyme F420-reducing hydrogenase delta subunit
MPVWEPAVEIRGGGGLRKLEFAGHALNRVIEQALPAALNPFSQLGAVANTCFLSALASGILLLCWYSPSVHQAWSSLEAMRANSFLGSLTRSVHRYSSDACVLFILLHAVKMFLARRFTGPRWLAWSTGMVLLAVVWGIGWSGYWLVWDVGAQHAALGTSKFIDQLPLLTEPMSRSFLTNESVPSLLFFVIFFTHLLGPLAIGLGLWIHLQRVNRARLLTARPLTLWIVGSLLLLALLAPATSGPAADMLVKVERFSLDWWFLWPVALTDRLGGGLLWLCFLGAGLLTTTIPWWLVRPRRSPVNLESSAAWLAAPRIATVELARCFGCTLCAKDCPFNAITMVARADGRKYAVQSSVDPDLCVSCGVCAGACDSDAINLPIFNSRDVGKTLNAWLATDAAAGRPSLAALLCAEAAGGRWRLDAEGRCAELPGYRVCRVPCVGWISAGLIERALQHGAAGVLIAGCAEGDPNCREGATWLQQRLEGKREPMFDERKADRSRVRFVRFDAARAGELVETAIAFRAGQLPSEAISSTPWRRWVGALILAVIMGGLTLLGSRMTYRTAHDSRPALVVSFNHGGERVSQHSLSKEDAAKRLPHMRNQVNLTRERVPVRLRVTVDGAVLHEAAYEAKGFSHDGPSLALERFGLAPGNHDVVVEIADTADGSWTKNWHGPLEFTDGRSRVVLFAIKSGFTVR